MFGKSKIKFDMKKIKMLSESCAIIDKTSNIGIVGNLDININSVKNPFTVLIDENTINNICEDTVTRLPQSNQVNIILKSQNPKIFYSWDLYPMRFAIKNTEINDNINIYTAKDLMEKLITSFDMMKMYDKIGGIGFNCELYIEQEKFLLKNTILKDDVANIFDSIQTKFQIKRDNATINIAITEDVLIDNKKSLLFSINTHINVNGKRDIQNAFSKKEEYLKLAKDSIEKVINK